MKNRSVKYTKDLLEEKILSFEWFVSADEKEATLIESLTYSDGAKFHKYMDRFNKLS